MRGQFATIEALISLMFVFWFITWLSSSTNSSISEFNSLKHGLAAKMASYDFERQANSNELMQQCLSASLQNGSGICIQSYLDLYDLAYHANLSIVLPNRAFGNEGNADLVGCFSLNLNGTVLPACMFEGG